MRLRLNGEGDRDISRPCDGLRFVRNVPSMRDRAEPAEQMDERPDASFKPGATDPTARTSDGALVRGRAFREKTSAGTAASSETVRLVCAVAAAVSLGVAFGLWLNARLASAASETPTTSARLTTAPDADTHQFLTSPPTAETPASDKGDATHVADGTTPSTNQDEAARDEGTRNERPRPPVEREERGRGAGDDAGGPTAGEHSASALTVGRNDVRPGTAATAARRQDGDAPCALYASASALTIANGGGATLVLGGPGRQGRVVVTTPDWSDIAVLSEGRAGGNGGWLRYSVRSVSKRTGAFAVSVKTPCVSLTIPVKVVRP
jgi:hypothetical protein